MSHRLLLLSFDLLSRLPLAWLQRLGRWLGSLFHRLPNREREQARVNLGLCFSRMPEAEREDLLRRTLQQNAITLLELPAIWRGKPEVWRARIRGTDDGPLRERLARGKGVILLAPHLGNWELALHYAAELAPITVLFRPPRQAALAEPMLEGRLKTGASRVVPTTDTSAIKALFQALRAGEMVGILPDQQPKQAGGGAAEFAPFFGVPALTMTLVSRLVAKTGAAVIYCFVERLPGAAGYQFHWLEGPQGIDDPDLQRSLEAVNRGVEECVRVCPAQYQWPYRRFDAQPGDAPSPYREI